ncbi:MAG TPA: GNAT family N-acetyltransferase [Chitinophagales bacterium]|nr:GNAT family N-acetyltransferase [Chitinophagales bacterium]
MKITRYGITLERIEKQHTELIRQWRNDQKISRFMFYKGEITPKMQEEWFESIDNEQNFFFLIYYQSQPVGLINISSIDWENKTSYTGLFIYDDTFLATDIPVMASLTMLDVFFLLFDMQSVYAKVKGNNKAAHNYNTALGFSRTKKIEFGLGYEYMLQKEIYLLEAKRLRNAAIRLKGNSTAIELNPTSKIDGWLKKKLSEARKDVLKNLEVKIISGAANS